eukprot:927957-Rhodomonas_salina.1
MDRMTGLIVRGGSSWWRLFALLAVAGWGVAASSEPPPVPGTGSAVQELRKTLQVLSASSWDAMPGSDRARGHTRQVRACDRPCVSLAACALAARCRVLTHTVSCVKVRDHVWLIDVSAPEQLRTNR